MRVDRVVGFGVAFLATFAAGLEVGAYLKARAAPPPAVSFRPAAPPAEYGLLGCPVTKGRIEEYIRVCRARSRLEKIEVTK